MVGSESNSSSASPSGKRSRDPEDEVYIDNLNSHKRYLSEIMASSLNGLTVGDPLPENLMESPARSDSMYYLRDEMSLQYSPMLEDIDDSQYCEHPENNGSTQPESLPTSPVSPFRNQRPHSGFSSTFPTNSYPSHICNLTAVTCSQPRQRGSDSEGRFPSSPSDICHSGDLRRAALMRSVQIRTQEEPVAVPNIEAEDRACACMKSLVDEREYRIDECSSLGISEPAFNREKSSIKSLADESEHDEHQVDECSSMGISEPTFNKDKSGRALKMKGELRFDDSENG